MKRVVILLSIILIVFPAFCAASYKPKAEVGFGAEFYHSSVAAESIHFRTSMYFGGDIVPVNFDTGRLGFGAGISLSYTTRSLAYGYTIIKPYFSFGPVLGIDLHFSRVFTMGFRTRLMFCYMGPVYVDKFVAIEVGLVPAFKLVSKNRFDLSILAPLTEVFRKDGYCLRFGVGAGITI